MPSLPNVDPALVLQKAQTLVDRTNDVHTALGTVAQANSAVTQANAQLAAAQTAASAAAALAQSALDDLESYVLAGAGTPAAGAAGGQQAGAAVQGAQQGQPQAAQVAAGAKANP